jgi:hypothetical protein
MAADDRADTGCSRVQVKGIDVVENVERESSHIDCRGFGQISGPIFPVHVSPDRINRSNCSQGGENLRGAHIARKKNELNSLEGSQRLGSNQAMGIGYDPHEVRFVAFGFSSMQPDSVHLFVWGRPGGIHFLPISLLSWQLADKQFPIFYFA